MGKGKKLGKIRVIKAANAGDRAISTPAPVLFLFNNYYLIKGLNPDS